MLILWPLSQSSPIPTANPPLPVSRPLVLPTRSPGNKDFHSCARGDAQQERKEGGVGGRKKRGCQGGTVCGSLRSGPLPKLCICVCFHSVCAASALLSPICASQSIFWESWVGKFGNWAPFKTSTLGLMLQFQNYVFSLQPQFSKKALIIQAKTLFSYMLLCILPVGYGQSFDLGCPSNKCTAVARFNAQQ